MTEKQGNINLSIYSKNKSYTSVDFSNSEVALLGEEEEDAVFFSGSLLKFDYNRVA